MIKINALKQMPKVLLFASVISLFLVGCYPMPSEEEYSTIPTTNNPQITREKNNYMPSIGY